jgi:Domain of unknown function (DUF4382)/Carboxypeptidase regulatory-like domain
MKTLKQLKLSVAALALTGLAACGGGGAGGGSADIGTLRLALTDAPSCGYDAVNVTVQKIRVHQSASASETDGGWSEIVLTPARRLNLLDLTNGVLDELGQTPLPAGKYTQLRLVLADNGGATPLANSVKPTGGAEVALRTPSGQQSGVKLNVNIDVAAARLADFVLDFDACKSVVVAGNSGQYLLKPVVAVIPRYVSGVAGFVDPGALANGNTGVSLQQAGLVVKATTPDSTGRFMLQPVAPGSYTLVVTAPGRSTGVVTGVLVAADSVTAVNAAGTALGLPASASGTASGIATVDTLVRALQTLTGGTTIEVTGRFVDGASGAYSYPLVVGAPQVAPYVAAPAALVFVTDAPAAGKYTLKASLAGFADQTAVLGTLAAGATLQTNFMFP